MYIYTYIYIHILLTVIQLIYHRGLIILELIKLSIIIRILYNVICSYISILIYFYYLTLLCVSLKFKCFESGL